MSAATMLASMQAAALGLFPWLGRFGPDPDTKRLQVRSAGDGLDLEGGGRAAAGKGHLVVRLFHDTVGGGIYVSSSTSAPYAWTPIATGIVPPTVADAGTPVTISEGSGKVAIDG